MDQKKFYRFVRRNSVFYTFFIAFIWGAFVTLAFAAGDAADPGTDFVDSFVGLFSSPAAYLLFTSGASAGYGLAHRTSVKGLKAQVEEIKAELEVFDDLKNDALLSKLRGKN